MSVSIVSASVRVEKSGFIQVALIAGLLCLCVDLLLQREDAGQQLVDPCRGHRHLRPADEDAMTRRIVCEAAQMRHR